MAEKYRECIAHYDESWANVELFRWQYGEMPKDGNDTREVDVMKGLGLLGEAIATGEATDRFNISQAVMRGAYELARLRAENEALRGFVEEVEKARAILNEPECDCWEFSGEIDAALARLKKEGG